MKCLCNVVYLRKAIPRKQSPGVVSNSVSINFFGMTYCVPVLPLGFCFYERSVSLLLSDAFSYNRVMTGVQKLLVVRE